MRPLLNEEERQYLLSICKEYILNAIVTMMNEKFNKDWTKKQIRSYLRNHKIKCGRSQKDKKGYVVNIRLLSPEEL